MAFPTPVRRGKAQMGANNTVWVPNITNWGLNTAIADGELARWYGFVASDGAPTLSVGVGSDSAWTKLSQTTDATNAITGAVFRAETTAAYAAGSFPTLELNSSASEQYSFILIAYKAAAGMGLTEIYAAASGNSIDADPPSITNDTGASIDAQVTVAAFHDSQVVATEAPAPYANLFTQLAANTQGASTSTARDSVTIADASSENPGVFTSTTEQWVAYTVAVHETTLGTTGRIKVWDGSAWVAKPAKVWNGASWVTKPVKYWTGSAWVETPY